MTHSYNTMNRASLLSLSLWVTVHILPVIRQPSLKQPLSLSLSLSLALHSCFPSQWECQAKHTPRCPPPLSPLSVFSSLFLSLWTTRQRSFSVICRTPSSLQVGPTQHFTVNLHLLKKKEGAWKSFKLPIVPAVHAVNNAGVHLRHYGMHSCLCMHGRHTNAHLRAALIIATHGVQHSAVHGCSCNADWHYARAIWKIKWNFNVVLFVAYVRTENHKKLHYPYLFRHLLNMGERFALVGDCCDPHFSNASFKFYHLLFLKWQQCWVLGKHSYYRPSPVTDTSSPLVLN